MFKKLFTLVLFSLLLPSIVLGAVLFERTPSGFSIYNPVSFEVSFDDFSDLECEEPFIDYWSFYFLSEIDEIEFYSEDRVLPTTLSHTFIETMPLGTYTELKLGCCQTYENECVDNYEFPLYDPEGLFEVGEAPLTYLEIPTEMPADMLAYAGDFFTDLGLLVVLAVGLPVGFKVIKKVISLMKIK